MVSIRGRRKQGHPLPQEEGMFLASRRNLQISSMKQEPRGRKYDKKCSKDEVGVGGMGVCTGDSVRCGHESYVESLHVLRIRSILFSRGHQDSQIQR